MDRIVRNGKSVLLYELADRIGNVVKEGDITREREVVSQNVVAMTRIGQQEEFGLKNNEHVLVVNSDEDMIRMDKSTEVIRVSNGACNDPDIEEWALKCSSRLRELVLCDDCLQYVCELKLVGFVSLEKVEIGMKCFSRSEEGVFEVSECNKLKSVRMGNGCCVHWREFVMKDCGVEEVRIGDGCFVSCEKTVFESKCCCVK